MAQEGQWKFLLGCGSIFILCFLIALYGVATGHADKVAEFLLVCLGLACIAGCGAAAGVKDVEPEAPMNTLNPDYEWTWRLTALIEQRLRRTKHVYTVYNCIHCKDSVLSCCANQLTSYPCFTASGRGFHKEGQLPCGCKFLQSITCGRDFKKEKRHMMMAYQNVCFGRCHAIVIYASWLEPGPGGLAYGISCLYSALWDHRRGHGWQFDMQVTHWSRCQL